MKFEYKVGMPICERGDFGSKGFISTIDKDGVWFKWNDDTEEDKEHWADDYEIIPDTPEGLAHITEVNQKTQAKIDEATSLLEQAFKAWFEAASLQAGRDVGNSEAYYLKHRGLDLSKFEGVVEANGWSTSSLYC